MTEAIYPWPLVEPSVIEELKHVRSQITEAALAEVGIFTRRVVRKNRYGQVGTPHLIRHNQLKYALRAQELSFVALGIDYELLTRDEYVQKTLETYPDWHVSPPRILHQRTWWAETEEATA